MKVFLKYLNGKTSASGTAEIEEVAAEIDPSGINYDSQNVMIKISSKTVTLPVIGALSVPFSNLLNLTLNGTFVADGSTDASVIKTAIDKYRAYHKVTLEFDSADLTVMVNDSPASSGDSFYVADNGTLAVGASPVTEGKTVSATATVGTYVSGTGLTKITADSILTFTVA